MKLVLSQAPESKLATLIFDCDAQFQRLAQTPFNSVDSPVSVFYSPHPVSVSDGEAIVESAGLRALSIGSPGLGILVSPAIEPSKPALKAVSPQVSSAGDLKFLHSVKSLLPAELLPLAEEMLAEARRLQPGGDLVEGGHRKFVNYPDNFVGFTAQTRNQAILVHVRGSSVSRAAETVRVAPDRRPYVRFWVDRPEQLPEALAIIKASWQRI